MKQVTARGAMGRALRIEPAERVCALLPFTESLLPPALEEAGVGTGSTEGAKDAEDDAEIINSSRE